VVVAAENEDEMPTE